MCWQAECWRDLDRLRAQMREDFGVTRARRSPTAVRVAVWTGLGAAVAILDAAVLAIPAAVAFEALVVPRLREAPPGGPRSALTRPVGGGAVPGMLQGGLYVTSIIGD
jgi:hypothetical protein